MKHSFVFVSNRTASLIAALCMGLAFAKPLCAIPLPQWKQDQSNRDLINKPIAAWQREEEYCYEYSNYTVTERKEAKGDYAISVRPAAIKCRQTDKKNSIKSAFEIRNHRPEFFHGLINNILVTDEGTGTEGRILTLYNVVDRSKIREVFDYYEPIQLKKKESLFFWMTASRATKQNCSQYDEFTSKQLGAAIEVQMYIDLTRNKLYKTNQYRCQPRQAPNFRVRTLPF